jgi:hypothetical protein
MIFQKKKWKKANDFNANVFEDKTLKYSRLSAMLYSNSRVVNITKGSMTTNGGILSGKGFLHQFDTWHIH